MIKNLWSSLRRIPFIVHEKGAAATEFALTLPIWVALLIGASDSAHLLIISQRVDRIAYSVSDIITQSEALTIADLNNTFLAAGELMQPYEFGDRGIVVVTSLYRPSGGTTKIAWQYSGGGSLVRPSKLGAYGSTPSLPEGLTLNENENVIVSEVFYEFEPLFINAGILQAKDLYRVAIYKPRLSSLITPPT